MNAGKLGVMFVDDEHRVLDGLRRQFRGKRHEWRMRFAGSGEEALAALGAEPADVVVSDMRMPGMSGAALLRAVRDRWPDTVRFVLTGETEQSGLWAEIGAAHQFIQKPCDATLIERAVTRTHELASAIESSDLRQLAAGIQSLPVLSKSHRELMKVLEDDGTGIADAARVVELDVGLSTKLMQMAHSAFFGAARKVTTVKEAVGLIGMKNLGLLAITSQVVDALSADANVRRTIEEIWRTSVEIGALAAELARKSGASTAVCDSARLAGTVSLVGRGILAREEPARFEAARDRAKHGSCKLFEAETVEFGVPQHAVGAYALGLWGFADEVIEAVARQAAPELSAVGPMGAAVRFVHLARTKCGGALADRLEPAKGWLEIREERSGSGTSARTTA